MKGQFITLKGNDKMKKLFTEDVVGGTMVVIYDTESEKAIPIHLDDNGNEWTLEAAQAVDWDNTNFGGCEDESGFDALRSLALNYTGEDNIVFFNPDDYVQVIEL